MAAHQDRATYRNPPTPNVGTPEVFELRLCQDGLPDKGRGRHCILESRAETSQGRGMKVTVAFAIVIYR